MTTHSDVPLVALRAFVSVGRHGNFTRAAAALGVTQGAVSRHVATLEARAGGPLFVRRGSTIAFTPAGTQLFDSVKDAVSTLELAAQQLGQRTRAPGRLQVRTSMPSFALLVLVPALGAFRAGHATDVDLITSLAAPQPQDEFDVLISRDQHLPDTESWALLQEQLVCVGAPAWVEARNARSSGDWPMIAARSRPDLIATWAVAREIAPAQLQVCASHDHLFLAIAAAIGGMGLLVVPQVLVHEQLRQGTLVAVGADDTVASAAIYTAWVNPRSAQLHSARAFCRWLKGDLRGRV